MVTYAQAYAAVSKAAKEGSLSKSPYGPCIKHVPEQLIKATARQLAFGTDLESALLRFDWGFGPSRKPKTPSQ